LITGDGKVGWRSKLAIEIRLIDKRALWGGGAALLAVAALGAASNVLGLPIAGAPSTLMSVVAADLGLVLVALGLLAPTEHATTATGVSEAEAAPTAASADVLPVEPEPVAVRLKARRPAAARLAPADEKRYRELEIFAGRGPVPPSALDALWESQGLSPEGVARLSAELIDRSLVGRGDDGLLVGGEPSGARSLVAAHGRLVDGYRSRCTDGSWSQGPDDGYFFDNITYHMAQANRAQELNRLLLDYDWLRAKLAVRGIIRLLADFAQQPMTADVEAVDRALVLSAACLAARPDRLASNLASRLVGSPSPGIDRLLGEMRERAPRPWICPVSPAQTSSRKSPQREMLRHDGPVRALAITPDGRRLITGGDDHTIRICDLATGRLERTLRGHTDSVRAVAVTPDGRRIVSGGAYDTVRVWDLASGQFVHAIAGQGGYRAVNAVAVAPDGGKIVWGGAGAAVQVWDLTNGRVEHTITSDDPTVRTVAITPNGQFVLSGGDGGTIQVWDLASGRLVRAIDGHTSPVFSVAVTPDGSRVVSGGHDNTVKVWELDSGRLELTLWGHTGPVDKLAVTPDGKRIVSGGQDKQVRIWDMSSGQAIASWNPDPDPESGPGATIMALCPVPKDPTRVVCGDSAGGVQVLRLLEA
jgi:hypothetical protein